MDEKTLETINKVSRDLAPFFVFGYHTLDDLIQEAFIFCVESLDNYDPSRGELETYLKTVVRSRFLTMIRNQFKRVQPPCFTCPLYDPHLKCSTNQCSEYFNKNDCKKWRNWLKRNNAKSSLALPINLEEVRIDNNEQKFMHSEDILEKMAQRELLDHVLSKVPNDIRNDLNRILDGAQVPKNRRNRIIKCIRDIAEEYYANKEKSEGSEEGEAEQTGNSNFKC